MRRVLGQVGGCILAGLCVEELDGIFVDVVDDVTGRDRGILDGRERWQLYRMPFWLRLEQLSQVSFVMSFSSLDNAHQLRPRLLHVTILARVLLVVARAMLLVVLRAHPVLIRRRLLEAILGLGMGSLLPHLVWSVSRRVELQGPSEKKL